MSPGVALIRRRPARRVYAGAHAALAEFIRLHGLRKGSVADRRKWAQDLLGEILKMAKAHRLRLESLELKNAGLAPDAWLCMLGMDSTTRVRLRIKRTNCLRPDDFGYWEVGDRALLKIAGFHAMLPNLNLASGWW